MSISIYSGQIIGFVSNVDWSLNNYGNYNAVVQVTEYNSVIYSLPLIGLYLPIQRYGTLSGIGINTKQQQDIGLISTSATLQN